MSAQRARQGERGRSDRVRKGTVISICGREGSGKTDWLLTLPKPMTIISVDPNTEGIVEKAVREGRFSADAITLVHIDMPAIAFSDQSDVKDEAEASWTTMIDALRPCIDRDNDDRPRSVGFDTATEVDQLNLLAEFGKTDQIHPEIRKNKLGPLNRRYMGMMRALQDAGIHVGLLHRVYDQYRTVEVRGKSEERRERIEDPWAMDRKGFRDTGYIASIEVLLQHDQARNEKLALQFGMKISRCMLRPILKGQEFWGRERQEDGTRVRRAGFPYLMAQVVEGSSVGDWS